MVAFNDYAADIADACWSNLLSDSKTFGMYDSNT